MVEMTVDSVRVSVSNGQRVVILKDLREERFLFIWISPDVAEAIALEMRGTKPQRPLTHDLLKNSITQLGGQIVNIVISDLRQAVYYARVIIEVNGRQVEIDARPSDAIALAVRAKCAILVEEAVLEEAAVMPEDLDPRSRKGSPSKSKSAADNLEIYRDFINNLDSLDDFGKE